MNGIPNLVVVIFLHIFVVKGVKIPIIGVITQPGQVFKDRSYLPASYVKFAEQGGAKVVPIKYWESPRRLVKLLSKLNGILLPGGHKNLWKRYKNETNDTLYYHSRLSTFENFTKFIVQYVMKENDEGRYLPIFGVCQGFENIILSLSSSHRIIKLMKSSEKRMSKLKFLDKDSRIYKDFDSSLIKDLETKNIVYYSHNHALLFQNFFNSPKIRAMFNPITTSTSPSGEIFISSFEAKHYPIYGFQFHLEKSNFEWANRVKRSNKPKSIEFSQKIANFFISEARKSKITNSYRFIKKNSIYKSKSEFYPLYMYVQTYYFPKPDKIHIYKGNEFDKMFNKNRDEDQTK